MQAWGEAVWARPRWESFFRHVLKRALAGDEPQPSCIEAPEQRRLIAVWTSPQSSRIAHPVIVALGRDGGELSRMGPHDSLDTHTWARLREEL